MNAVEACTFLISMIRTAVVLLAFMLDRFLYFNHWKVAGIAKGMRDRSKAAEQHG